MRILLSTIGSRGDVQPLVALASELKALGEDVHLCVPPDFRAWIEGLGMAVTPIGPEVRSTGKISASAARITPEQRRQMIEGTVAAQFETIAAAARGCDIIVGATALQIAAPSVAERMGIPYVFAAYCPIVLPSRHHAPPVLVSLGDAPAPPVADYSEHWAQDTERWNDAWRPPLNAQRASLGLAPIDDVRSHVLTARPWLAADPTLAPWPEPADESVFQTGAWILADDRPLAPEIEAFLDAGEPPVYFGFGSIGPPENLSRVMIESARALGRRAIVLRGWAELALIDDGVRLSQHRRGESANAIQARRGGRPPWWRRHHDRGRSRRRAAGRHPATLRSAVLGAARAAARRRNGARDATPSAESLTAALEPTLQPDVAARARAVAAETRGDGARIAARALLTTVGRG